MTEATKSYLKVAYDLRPAKQVERRMILDALGRLMNEGVPIRDYQYTGLGSVYFFDFILLYRLFGLTRFLSVEFDRDITKRVEFNKPFDPIAIRMEPIGDVIPDLSRDSHHIVWLDYDDRLKHSMLEDTSAAAFHLSAGSLLLVTIDADPPPGTAKLADRVRYFEEEAGDLLPFDFDATWCVPSRLAETNLTIVGNAIRSGLAARDVRFLPLFRFAYADGHEMVTLGGMIGGDRERRKIDACNWADAAYLRRGDSDQAYRIHIPRLTRRERLLLDHNMPCAHGWRPEEFEIDDDEINAYREIHRFYPLYGELLA